MSLVDETATSLPDERNPYNEGRPIPIVSAAEFERRINRDPALLARQPWIIEGIVERWPAAKSWSDLSHLRSLFGNLQVTAGAPQFVTQHNAPFCQVSTTYGRYLEYLQEPDRGEDIFRDSWKVGDLETWRTLKRPLYCGNLWFVRSKDDPVLADIAPHFPPGLECWNDELSYYYAARNHIWLYVAPAGALTPLHTDNNGVIAYLGQITGRKRAILYSPADKRHYFRPDVGFLNPLAPDPANFPTWELAQPWVAELNPGQLLIWGPEWAHHVVTEEQSVTVSVDIVNELNVGGYARSDGWMTGLGNIVRQDLEPVLSQHPSVEAAMREGAPPWQAGYALAVSALRQELAGELLPRSRRIKERLLTELLARTPVPTTAT